MMLIVVVVVVGVFIFIGGQFGDVQEFVVVKMEWEIILEIVEKLEIESLILEKKFVIKFNWLMFEIKIIVFLN